MHTYIHMNTHNCKIVIAPLNATPLINPHPKQPCPRSIQSQSNDEQLKAHRKQRQWRTGHPPNLYHTLSSKCHKLVCVLGNKSSSAKMQLNVKNIPHRKIQNNLQNHPHPLHMEGVRITKVPCTSRTLITSCGAFLVHVTSPQVLITPEMSAQASYSHESSVKDAPRRLVGGFSVGLSKSSHLWTSFQVS